MKKIGLLFALTSVVAVSACSLSQPPDCLIGSEKCEQSEFWSGGVLFVCSESNTWLPVQSCASCQSGVCSNSDSTIMCENEGTTSCSDLSTVSVQFECLHKRTIPRICGNNCKCDEDHCSEIRSGCETDGETQCHWIDELQTAIQIVCVDHEWMTMYCGHGLGCNGNVCATPDNQVRCTKPGEIPDNSKNQCICDTENHWTGTAGKCECEDGYLKIDNICEKKKTCTEENEILDEATNQCVLPSEGGTWNTDYVDIECGANLSDPEDAYFLDSDGNNCITCSELVKKVVEGELVKKDVEVGDIIYFGHYQQLYDDEKKYPIAWQVLAVDDDGVTVISKYILDGVKYNETQIDVTWEKSTLRSWLNGLDKDANLDGKDYTNDNFIKTAFNDEELKCIQTVTHKNPDNQYYDTSGGNDTEDKIFLLSLCEAGYQPPYNTHCPEDESVYFTAGSEKIAYATSYAKTVKQVSTYTNYLNDVSQYYKSVHYSADWWLRSSGSDAVYVYVYSDGSVYYGYRVSGIDEFPGVRPVMRLKR